MDFRRFEDDMGMSVEPEAVGDSSWAKVTCEGEESAVEN